MEMLFGEYNNTLDDKGRIQFPAKLRSVLQQESLVVTQGLDRCLMIFSIDEWTSLNKKIVDSASLFNDQKRLVMRRFIAPAQKLDFEITRDLKVNVQFLESTSIWSFGILKSTGLILRKLKIPSLRLRKLWAIF